MTLNCNHRFCKSCWKEYLVRKVWQEGESGKVQCMESGCGRVVGEKVVEGLIEGKALDR